MVVQRQEAKVRCRDLKYGGPSWNSTYRIYDAPKSWSDAESTGAIMISLVCPD